MGRRRRSKLDVSLFPFLSVLCALIGVMVLFLLVNATTRVQKAMADAEHAAREIPLPPREISKEEGLSDEEFQRVRKQLDELTDQLTRRQQELVELKQLEHELASLISEKEAELQRDPSEEELVTGVNLEPKADVKMRLAEDRRVNKRPNFIEITADEYVIHPGPQRFRLDEIAKVDSPFRKVLAGIDKRRRTDYILMLVHPAGTQGFDKLYPYLQSNHTSLEIGYEPFSSGWLLMNDQGNGTKNADK
jgi:hypothetical protein